MPYGKHWTPDALNAYKRARYKARRAQGLCACCRAQSGTRSRCALCRQMGMTRRRMAGRRWYHRHREAVEVRRKAVRDALRAQGLCITCRVPSLRYTRCLLCRQKNAASTREFRARAA